MDLGSIPFPEIDQHESMSDHDTPFDTLLRDVFPADRDLPFNVTDSLNLSALPTFDHTFSQPFGQAFAQPSRHSVDQSSGHSWLALDPGQGVAGHVTTHGSGDSKQSYLQKDSSNDSPKSITARESRLAKKRLNQKHYRQREKVERQQATARVAELEVLLSQLSAENTRLKLKHTALEIMVDTLDRVVAGLLSDDVIERGTQTNDEYIMCVKTAQNMTMNEFRGLWRGLINEGADLLLQVESGDAEAYAVLESRCAAGEGLLMHLEVIQPVLSDEIGSINLETGAVEDPGMEFWMQRVQGVGLTDEQLELVDDSLYGHAHKQLEEARERVLENVKKMVDQDKRRLDVIANRPNSTITHVLRAVDFNCHPDMTVPALERMLQREGLMGALLSTYICGVVLNVKQKTSIAVSTYPYIIRTPLIVRCMKQIRAEREALGTFRGKGLERRSR